MDHRIDALVAKHRPWLLVEARRMCGAQVDAEDLVQETFTKFLETFGAMPSLPHEGACVKWLTVTLSHRFIDQCRKLRSRTSATPELTAMAQDREVMEPDPEPPPAYDRVTDAQLVEAVEALGPATRAAYELHAAGHSNLEIAETLGIKPGAVGKRLHDARVKLRGIFKSLAPGDN